MLKLIRLDAIYWVAAQFRNRWFSLFPQVIPMATLNDVTDYIIMKMSEGRPLNVLKLHKLVYYVQAWNLAFKHRRLFEGNFQAWVHGPVSRTLYDRYSEKSMYSLVSVSDIAVGFSPDRLTEDERAHIDAVLEVYGDLAGYQLEDMTHREDPWLEARGSLPATARSEAVISDQTMARYYGQRVNH
jgi:uncharacterized phage-associated protein